MALLTSTEDVRRVLKKSKTVAVLGAHPKPAKAAHYVPRYLQGTGYTLYPVNPNYLEQDILGEPVHESLADLRTSVDVVDVFRRSEALPDHVADILAMTPRPKVVWFQLGIRNDAVAAQLSEAGIDVIQDRCMLADHQYLL